MAGAAEEKQEDVIATDTEFEVLKHERNVLQRICARRADALEAAGLSADATVEEAIAAAPQWEEFSGLTPIDKPIMLWFIGNDAPKISNVCCIGQISSYEPGKVWDGISYRPIEWFSHWRNLPIGPNEPHPSPPPVDNPEPLA